jgi:hypothetical protein
MSQSLSNSEKTHYTNLWCREKGIHASDLEKHPQADDVVLLIKFREQLWPYMEKSEQGVWAALWSWTYTRQLALKKKHLQQLENIGNSVNFKQTKQAQRQATIRAMRKRLQG